MYASLKIQTDRNVGALYYSVVPTESPPHAESRRRHKVDGRRTIMNGAYIRYVCIYIYVYVYVYTAADRREASKRGKRTRGDKNKTR